jgi:pimeloyl-ACP methyl ester carboxylesterase
MSPLQLTDLKNHKVSYRKIGNGPRKILFFHGFPGSSSQIRLFESSLSLHSIEVLCFDRPCYNQTSFLSTDMMQETLQIAGLKKD